MACWLTRGALLGGGGAEEPHPNLQSLPGVSPATGVLQQVPQWGLKGRMPLPAPEFHLQIGQGLQSSPSLSHPTIRS